MDVLKATSMGTFFISFLASLFYTGLLNSCFVFVFWISGMTFTMTTRMSLRMILHIMRNRGRNLRQMVVVGTNEKARRFAKKIRERKNIGYNIIGFVDNECVSDDETITLLSDLNHFEDVLNKQVIDEVVIALPAHSFYREISKILCQCGEQGIKVRFIADMLFDLPHTKSTIEYLDDAPMLTFHMGPSDSVRLWIKRVMDIIISAIALILLIPFFAIVVIIIKLDSRGPIFFVQKRMGYNKRRFNFYKFRTMMKDAEKKQKEIEYLNEVSGPVFKIKDDPRVTKIGKILRKTSIDELPQLINVLTGDMSLVGPRPLPVRDYLLFEESWQKRRLSVRPGITCLWQVSGRNELPFEKWIELDMEYIDNWSLFLDLKILVKTIPAVFRGTGAM
jgi:exopolysaccharide biosynthesis polyprenyl glycosylphosphotransferase